jgi:uncharacterized protein (PEP-CTERM system associated)
MRLNSGPAYKLFAWNVAYTKETIDYTRTQDVDLETISAWGRRLITPQFGIQAQVGYEDNNYITTGPKPSGSFWNIGPEWTPTPRTRLSATTGRRFFGSTQSLDFTHRTRLTSWALNYNEDVTTTRQELFIPSTVDTASLLDSLFLARFPDPIARQQAVQAFIAQTGLPAGLTIPVNFFTSTPFLVKRLRGSFGIHGARNTILANVFTETREATSTTGQPGAGDFAASPNTKQTGTSFIWTLRIMPQLSSSLDAGFTRTEFPGLSRQDDLTYVRLGITRQFQPRVSGTLSFRRLENDSNQPGGGYTENAVSAALSMRF